MTTITAQTILSSQHADFPEHRLTTMLLRYPRCIHAEFMTHRVFSRNAASSRAIPVAKLIKDVEDNPFVPLVWGREQKGMQGGDEIDSLVQFRHDAVPRDIAWLRARDVTVQAAKQFAAAGYHKQIVNRLLEPFAHITVLVSATEWENFLHLRDHTDAEPHIQLLAKAVRAELEKPAQQTLFAGDWHLPFLKDDLGNGVELPEEDLIKFSVACCASTSYKTVDGFDMTLDRAKAIYDKLVGSVPWHASPLEHQARAGHWLDGHYKNFVRPDFHRNFRGFEQYRAIFEDGEII